MKKVLAILLMTAVTNAMAYRDDPNEQFKLHKGTETIALILKVVDNPKAACDIESRKRGNNGFSYQVQACAFWTQDTCTVVVGTTTTMHTLGHEIRHCFQGDWHPQ